MPDNPDTGARLRSAYSPEGGAGKVFSSKVADYVASRPDYPAALYTALAEACPPAPGRTVVDVGAGTGLLTLGLLKRGYRVIAVEPNPDMRRESDRLLGEMPGYASVEGSAESLPLEAASSDFITAAQAFHWFDLERARTEFLRVLTPQGLVALIWNDRRHEDPLQAALDEFFVRFGGTKRAALVAHEERKDVPAFFGTPPRRLSWPHSHRLDANAFLSLIFSRSYMPAPDTPEGRQAADLARALFHRHAADNQVEVRYRTLLILGRPDTGAAKS